MKLVEGGGKRRTPIILPIIIPIPIPIPIIIIIQIPIQISVGNATDWLIGIGPYGAIVQGMRRIS